MKKKQKWIKIKYEEKRDLEETVKELRSKYFNASDALEILKARVDEREKNTNLAIHYLNQEVFDLRVILAGSVCKKNPFLGDDLNSAPPSTMVSMYKKGNF